MLRSTLNLLGVLMVYGSVQVAGQFDYTKCENTICFGLPENCLTTLNCLAVGKVVKINPNVYEFDVQTIPDVTETNPIAYVAIGLSIDSRMEDDSVVECVVSNNEIEVFMSYTRQGPRGADRHEHTNEISVTHRSYTNGSIHCIFERQAVTFINNQTFDMNQLSYHMLLAIGNGVDVNSLRRHTNRLASSEPLIVPEIVEVPNENIDYNACGTTHTCFGIPSGCTVEKNCHTAVAINYTSPTYKFQMVTSSGSAYVAIGLSVDSKMGEDSVVECVRENGTVNMYTSYTRDDHTGTDRHPANGLATLLHSSYVDGKIHCYVERTEVGTVFGQIFDLANQPFYILIAIGDEATTTGIVVHKQKQASSQAIFLHDNVQLKQAGKPLLIKLHGCFMIIAWMGTAAVGVVFSRYFKNEWTDKKIFGKDIWFVGHITCMVITWTLTIAGFVVIFVHVGGWTQIGQVHGTIGIIVTILCLVQTIAPIFRPHPNHEKRYRFNIGHYLTGRITFLLAIVNIIYAIFLSSAEIPIWFTAIMVLFVLVFWGNHVVMGIMAYLTDGDRGLIQIIRAFFGPAKRIDYKKGEYSAWYVRMKTTVFLVYLAAITVFVITGVLVVLLSRN